LPSERNFRKIGSVTSIFHLRM